MGAGGSRLYNPNMDTSKSKSWLIRMKSSGNQTSCIFPGKNCMLNFKCAKIKLFLLLFNRDPPVQESAFSCSHHTIVEQHLFSTGGFFNFLQTKIWGVGGAEGGKRISYLVH